MYGGWLPAFLMLMVPVGLGGTMVLLSILMGPRRPEAAKSSTYECGIAPFQDARERFPVKFYLVGVLFLLFDLETVLLVPWGALGADMGWEGVAAGAVFLGVLAVGLAYAWGKGVLDWGND